MVNPENLYPDLDSVSNALTDADNVMTVKMGQLRDAFGVRKLGVNVIRSIKEELDSRGIGYYPEELRDYQSEPVRLYKKGTPVAHLIRTLTTFDEESDDKLRQFAASDAEAILQKIRNLVAP
jgi:hypothetical protein